LNAEKEAEEKKRREMSPERLKQMDDTKVGVNLFLDPN
jgi:hypothetical protein